MESFRSVHLLIENGDKILQLSHVVDCQMEAQLYIRNILDRYPLIPSYLAHRLAITNKGRAERLRKLQIDHEHENVNGPLPPTIQYTSGKMVQGKEERVENAHEDMQDRGPSDSHRPSRVVGKEDKGSPQRTTNEDHRLTGRKKGRVNIVCQD